MKRWAPLGLLVALVVIAFGVYVPFMTGDDPVPSAAEPVVLWTCHVLLIGMATEMCTEDVEGPGRLTIRFKPDPPRGGWEVGVSGLAALAESCEFHGSYDQTRLSALQGRGETVIACPIEASVDRAFHEITFTGKLEAAGTSMAIEVSYER